ncbi:sterol desaturase family protein [Zavarzinia sp. CC-PAN008]|uniref:sterol desaturase family protein n=1 Tax=Zavarzinia sp. CC-PAN008 TaxID=3243332 RepID=UPI003F7457D6
MDALPYEPSRPAPAGPVRLALAWLLWPLLLSGAIAGLALAHALGQATIGFDLVYIALALVLLGCERLMPHEPAWQRDDGQIGPDLAHTLLNKGFIAGLLLLTLAIGAGDLLPAEGRGLWPSALPFALQVALGLVIAEAALYTIHRLAHEWPRLWRFHAVHHSSVRLWVVNTGRFHAVDSLAKTIPALALAAAVGAPGDVILWVSAITAFIGLLTHCNVEMRFGALSLVFNTPELHRWHHSKVLDEGNRNYGENLVLFDQLFGTYCRPPRRPPADIGIDAAMPATFWGQLKAPFQ